MYQPKTDKAVYWHETDLEPDDVLALMMLPAPEYVVVGEGDVGMKFLRASQYYEMLGSDPRIAMGEMSDKPFHGDGKEFETPLVSNRAVNPETNRFWYMNEFRSFAESVNPIMVSLKPMRELFGWYLREPVEVTKLIARVSLYAYGGFNFRCLLSRTEDRTGKLCEFLRGFKRVSIYETFHATGVQNSMNKTNAPEVYKLLDEFRHYSYVAALFKLTTLWNEHLVKSLEADVESRSDPDAQARNRKAIDSIRGNEEFQYVVADFGLAACMLAGIAPEPVKDFRIEGGYSKFELDAGRSVETGISVYRGIDFESLIRVRVLEAVKVGLEQLRKGGYRVVEKGEDKTSL